MKSWWHLALRSGASIAQLARREDPQALNGFPDKVDINSGNYTITDPSWLKMVLPMICIKKDNRAADIDPYIYYNDTCLTGNSNGRLWGHLGASPELPLLPPNAQTVPRSGLWLGFMDVDEVQKGGNTNPPGPERNTFVIANAQIGFPDRPRCLTWQNRDGGSRPNMELLDRHNIGFGETFNSKSLSFWTGRIVLSECNYINNTTLPLDFSKISDNQKFWVVKERTDNSSEIGVASVRRRIMPRLPDIPDPWTMCMNHFGIFDSWELGYQPDYYRDLPKSSLQRTSIGWGCSPQRWTLVGTSVAAPEARKYSYSLQG
ncbi:hypothetical protein TWF102_002474 [Orbilia oligospora]|uniref:Uncharacterized protein n=1 Tax=Orbilia oligospora TaxID=2813651 RepID=A0A7C8J097_ORBOL|nr:hypothetical protein TWF102_002474 [Orbilia oligospora]